MASKKAQPDTSRRILKAACDAFERGGITAVSIRRIAKIVQVTPMAIYNHFAGREALVVAIYERGVERLARQLWRGVVRADTPMEKLRAIIRTYAVFGIKNPNYYSLLFGSGFIQKYSWDRPPRSLIMRNFWVPFTEIIEACQEAGGIDPKSNAQEVATHIWASLHGYVSFLIIGRLQQLWRMDEKGLMDLMEKHLLRFL